MDARRVARPASPSQGDQPLVPYHAGESQGLEFLSDICQPSRPFKGNIYIIGRQRSKFADPKVVQAVQSEPLPDTRLRHELLHCYFRYVHPFLPLLNAADFLTAYNNDPDRLSSLLLWSVLFASASVRAACVSPRAY